MQPQLIPYRGCQQITRALVPAAVFIPPDSFVSRHLNNINTSVQLAHIPAVSNHAVNRGRGSRPNRSMPRTGACGHIIKLGICEGEPLIHEALKPVFTQMIPESCNIFVPNLFLTNHHTMLWCLCLFDFYIH